MNLLTHISLTSFLWDILYANRIALDGTQQNMASHLGLFCLLILQRPIWGYSVCLHEFHQKSEIKMKNYS